MQSINIGLLTIIPWCIANCCDDSMVNFNDYNINSWVRVTHLRVNQLCQIHVTCTVMRLVTAIFILFSTWSFKVAKVLQHINMSDNSDG